MHLLALPWHTLQRIREMKLDVTSMQHMNMN